MATTFKTLPAAMSKLENARRFMGRGYLYRIKRAANGNGFNIACYSAPLKCPAWAMSAGYPLALVDGDIRAFLGFY